MRSLDTAIVLIDNPICLRQNEAHMYGRNSYDFNLGNPHFEEESRFNDEVGVHAEELYQDIKKHGVMMSTVRVYTDYPRFSSSQGTVLEEMTEWSIDYKDHQNGELLDAMFNESKRERLLVEFCWDYAAKLVGED